MRLLTTAALLSGIGVATAFVIPDEPIKKQLSLLNQETVTNPNLTPNSNKVQEDGEDAIQKWWDALSPKDTILTSFEQTFVSSDFLNPASFFDWPDWGGGGDHDHPDHPHHPPPHHPHHPPHHGDPTKTIYELIKSSNYTTKLASLIDDHPEIKSLLQTSPQTANYTFFAPTDKAFERIPDHHKDNPPPKEFILALLRYHIVPGIHSTHGLSYHHTLPTNLSSHSLGHHPQRIRISTSLSLLPFHRKITLNFFTHLLPGHGSNIPATNGLIHAIDHILIPPPSQEKIIALLPSAFSTFRLGLEITGLGEELADREKEESQRNGGTLFAPTNRAFAKLGPRANAFLFSDYGKKYLKALLKYHVVVNATLYSDEFYERPLEDEDFGRGNGGEGENWGGHHGKKPKKEYKRIDLPSLLDEKPVSVGITRWKSWVVIKVNDKVPVVVQDGLARDGVIQVVGSVLIPPHKHHDGDDKQDDHDKDEDDSVVDLDDLKARLEPYLEEEEGTTDSNRGSGYLISEDL